MFRFIKKRMDKTCKKQNLGKNKNTKTTKKKEKENNFEYTTK